MAQRMGRRWQAGPVTVSAATRSELEHAVAAATFARGLLGAKGALLPVGERALFVLGGEERVVRSLAGALGLEDADVDPHGLFVIDENYVRRVVPDGSPPVAHPLARLVTVAMLADAPVGGGPAVTATRGRRAIGLLGAGGLLPVPSHAIAMISHDELLGLFKRRAELEDRFASYPILAAAGPAAMYAREMLARLAGTRHDQPPGRPRVTEEQRAALVGLQDTAARLYGRIEPGRAIAWTVEELGEVAQAMRRDMGAARVREEIGHLFAWVLCLANIAGIGLADAAARAIDDEVDRQLSKHGRIKPYAPKGSSV